MNILVMGATGYIGSAVANRLLDAGYDVSGLARSAEAAAALEAQRIRAVTGEFADTRGLAELARSFEAVVWTASSNRADLDAPAVTAVLEGLRGTAKTFVYTSGVWVHGDTHGRVADEEAPLEPAELVAFRVPLERHVRGTPGVRGIVVRPGIVYGQARGIPAMLTDSARRTGHARFVGSGENRWPVVFRDDLAELYRLVLERAPAGSTFIGVQGQSCRVAHLAAAASEGAGAGGRTLSWPLAEARRELGAFADALVLDQEFSSGRAARLLEWVPRGPSIVDELRRGSYACSP